jgi:hypothetical protein
VKVKKVTNIGYKMDRMNMTAATREKLARQNMQDVLNKKYGEGAVSKMRSEYLTGDML